MKEQSRSGLHTTIMCSPNSGNQLSDSPNHYQLTTSADILQELPSCWWIRGLPPSGCQSLTLRHMCFRRPINVCWQFQIEVTCCHGAKYPLSLSECQAGRAALLETLQCISILPPTFRSDEKRFRVSQLFSGNPHLLPHTHWGLKGVSPLDNKLDRVCSGPRPPEEDVQSQAGKF